MLLAFTDIPQRHDRLTVFPVVGSGEPDICLLSMEDAVQAGDLSFGETRQDDDCVLIARNRGSKPVLILDGEKLLCGRRFRLRTPSILLGPNSETEIPFWGIEYEHETSDDEWLRHTPAWLKGFPILEKQVGVLAFLGRRFLGLDALGSPKLYAPFHCRLMTEYLMEAFGARRGVGPGCPTHDTEVCALAGALEIAERIPSNTPGRGKYRVLRGPVWGGELSHEGHLIHLSVFPAGVEA
jgi:hypothetical protein